MSLKIGREDNKAAPEALTDVEDNATVKNES
jgi:hypothetical protein